MTLTLEQRAAERVVTADRQLHFAERNLALVRELERDDLVTRAEDYLADAQLMLTVAIETLRSVSDLTGIETEDGAVLRAFLIVSDAVTGERD